jgi:putative spermidine/putrescine transport system ATP-binding protein
VNYQCRVVTESWPKVIDARQVPSWHATCLPCSIYIDGLEHTHTPVHRRDIGMVFQSYALLPHLTVDENVALPLRMLHRPDAEIRRRVTAALEMVQLGQRMPRAPSGGQQQRVALARCFVYQP